MAGSKSGPQLIPRTKRTELRVFIDPGLRTELDDIAAFHGEVFALLGAEEVVSRNDIINAFLEWAVREYWHDKGGKPMSPKDRAEKAKRHAAAISKERPE